jgi:predicted DsbA family dithiol-disulfide isomerase
MQTASCCCPVCESYNRDFVCPNCVNSQQLKEREHQQLSECLAQAESLRAQRAELLKSLEEHLAARVSTLFMLYSIGLPKRKSCDQQHQQARIDCGLDMQQSPVQEPPLSRRACDLVLQEVSQNQQIAAWRRAQELKAAQAKAEEAKAALAKGVQASCSPQFHTGHVGCAIFSLTHYCSCP